MVCYLFLVNDKKYGSTNDLLIDIICKEKCSKVQNKFRIKKQIFSKLFYGFFIRREK